MDGFLAQAFDTIIHDDPAAAFKALTTAMAGYHPCSLETGARGHAIEIATGQGVVEATTSVTLDVTDMEDAPEDSLSRITACDYPGGWKAIFLPSEGDVLVMDPQGNVTRRDHDGV